MSKKDEPGRGASNGVAAIGGSDIHRRGWVIGAAAATGMALVGRRKVECWDEDGISVARRC